MLPRDVSIQHFRIISSLMQPSSHRMDCNQLAHALTMRPSDVEDCLMSLADLGLVEQRACAAGEKAAGVSWHLTPSGAERSRQLGRDMEVFRDSCLALLDDEDKALLSRLLENMQSVPGSFRILSSYPTHCDPLAPVRSTSVIATLLQAILATLKNSCKLSLTDYRFLLELYPKKRSGRKVLRARDMVAFLRTGRAYVTTTSMRLEEQGLIERIPDERDARGILFTLAPAGFHIVQSAGDDIFAVLVSMFGDAIEGQRTAPMLKRLLQGEDEALVALRGR